MEKTRLRLGEGIYLTYLPAVKFKTSFLSAQFIAPLRRETAALNALLPTVLCRGTEQYPDMSSFEAQLDLLYGANVESSCRKRGENQLFGFVATCIDDAFTPNGEKLLEPLAQLLGDLICHPAMEKGSLVPAYVESEKTNLIDGIRSSINDKRTYAAKRLLEEMCADEPYGLSHVGEEETAAAITPGILTTHYRRQIATCRLELYYCGTADLERVKAAYEKAFADLSREQVAEIVPTTRRHAPAEPKMVTESMDVTQGKLSLGFRVESDDPMAAMVMNAMFGGTSNAKLFMNVREKLSLCYYASSGFHRQKSIITVASGIEFADYQRAYDEILAQLEAMKNGDWEDWELTSAKSSIRNTLQTMADSAGRMEDFYMGQIATGQNDSPESMLAAVEAVTPERICAAAQSVVLDTVYFLKGKEA